MAQQKTFTRLTRPAVRKLAPGQSINEHGITATRTPTGDVRWIVNVMVDGRRIHRTIGLESDGTTREQAERAIETWRTHAREDRLNLPSGRKTHLTFAAAAATYLQRIEDDPRHGRNMVAKRRHMASRLVPHFKGTRPDKLTDFAIAGYAKARRDAGAKAATVNRELSTLSHFLNRLHDWKMIAARPAIHKASEDRKPIRILSPADQQALMQAAIGDQDPQLWLFVAIATKTGMRHSEILRLQWDDVDTQRNRLNIGRAKAGQRHQPIPPSLSNLLAREIEQRGKPTGYIFPTERAGSRHPHRLNMSKQFARAAIRAGLDPSKVTPHILRHSAITALVQAGVDLPTVQKVSGHKTLAMVLRYTHVADAHVDASIAKLDAAFPDVVTPNIHRAPIIRAIDAA